WLERWHMPDGTTEFRRVSASVTEVVVVGQDGCGIRSETHRRTFDSATMSHAFTDERLRDLLSRTRDGMIYVWSPGMPLSVSGIAQAKTTADSLGIAFTAVVADARAGELESTGVERAYQQTLNSFELVYRNATVHYPTTIFYRDGQLLGSA